MKLVISLFSLFVLSFGLTGCSENKSSGEDTDPYPYYRPENYSGLKQELTNARFYCASSEECPLNVGLLFSNMDGSEYEPRIAQCTGFLVADNIIATNSHCIPSHLKSPKKECDSQIAIRFLGDSGKENIFNCKQVLDYSPVGVFDPDYAFIQIEATGIEPLPIHKGGLKDNQKITLAKVTPLPEAPGGILEVENCKVALGTLLNLKGTNSWSRTAVGLGCKGINGNSGSPVLNEDNKVIGILQSKMLDNYSTLLERNFKSFRLSVPSPMAPHFIFTSLSCIADPVTGMRDEEKCGNGESLDIIACSHFNMEQTNESNKKVYDRWKKSLPPLFVYEYITDEGSLTTMARPVCVKSKDQFPDYDRYVTLKGFYGFRKESIDLVYPQSITIGARVSIDEEYRINPEMSFEEEMRSEYRLNLEKEDGAWSGTMNSTMNSNYGDRRLGIDLTQIKIPLLALKDCTNEQIKDQETSKIKLSSKVLVTEEEYKKLQPSRLDKVCEK